MPWPRSGWLKKPFPDITVFDSIVRSLVVATRFECLAERTIALAQQARRADPQSGFDPLLEARMEEVLQLVNKEISTSGYRSRLNAGVVITGGTALLANMVEMAEQIFDMPVRIGKLKHVVFGDKVDVLEFDTVFNLFEFIEGIVWQLSFHRSPKECALRR